MGISGSQKALMAAQSGVERAGATRSNVHSTQTFIAIAGVQVAAARAVAGQQVDAETLSITAVDGETPNTATFQVRGFTPTHGQDVVITQGSINNLDRLFAGTVLSDTSGYVGTPANSRDTVSVIDYTWQLTRETITQRWTNVSATVIAQDIITHAGRGFSTRRVEADLPILDEFTVTNQTHAAALSALAKRIGAAWKPTYHKDVKFRMTPDPNETDPTMLTAASALLTEMTGFAVRRDLGPVITRQPVEGGGSTALTEVAPGETILPLAEIAWYSAAGGMVASGPQQLTYTGVQVGGAGSVVGPGVSPSAAPALTPQAGAGLGAGIYQYAYTDVTGSGESLPSPLGTVTTGPISAPSTALTGAVATGAGVDPGTYRYGVTFTDGSGGETLLGTASGDVTTRDVAAPASAPVAAEGGSAGVGEWNAGDSLYFAVTYLAGSGETVASAVSGTIVSTGKIVALTSIPVSADAAVTGKHLYMNRNGTWRIIQDNSTASFIWPASLTGISLNNGGSSHAAGTPPGTSTAFVRTVNLSNIPVGPVGTAGRKIYRYTASDPTYKLQQTIANNTATTATDTTAQASLGAAAPGSNTTALNQVTVASIALGPSGTTSRKLYRTAVNGSQLKLHTTIANNTDTTLGAADTTADGSLGANAPTSDTSGLTQPTGQINAGSTTLLTAGLGAIPTSGWMRLGGNQVIRYTGTSGNTLTGIPATGPGAIQATIAYNTTITAAPALSGIPASGAGSIRYAIKQGDPVNVRVVIDDLAAQAVIAARMGGTDDGVIEGPLIQDGRISETEARARGQAQIDLRKTVEDSVTLVTRDTNAHASRALGVNLAAPAYVGSLKIQQVTISHFTPARWPIRQVSASSRRVTLEDLLRRARAATTIAETT